MTITLPKEQWIEIREGLKKGEHDARLVRSLQEAIEQAEREMENSEKLIAEMKKDNSNLQMQVHNYNAALYNLQTTNLQMKNNLLFEKNKRFSLSAVLALGYGTGSSKPQIFLGGGAAFTLFKF